MIWPLPDLGRPTDGPGCGAAGGQHQALTQGRYVLWLQPLQRFPGRQQPPAVQDGSQHLYLYLHLGGLTSAERAR
jgi:hypothetical protein